MDKKWIYKEIFSIIILGVLIILIQGYFDNKWEPIRQITISNEQVYLEKKREVFSESMEIITKFCSTNDFSFKNKPNFKNSERNRTSIKLTEQEVNNCINKLCMYTKNDTIIIEFKNVLKGKYIDSDVLQEKINLIITLFRKELGFNNSNVKEYEYILMPKDNFTY